MRAAIYARLSKDTAESTSISRQIEACEKWIEAKGDGWTVVTTETDVDVSGSKVAPWDRPGFSKILARDDVEVVVAYRIDRLGRSILDFATLVDRLTRQGIKVSSTSEDFDLTSQYGFMMANMLALFAEMEAKATGARVASSIERLRKVGRWSHGYAPFGYRIVPNPDGPGKALAVVPEEAKIVHWIADRTIAGDSFTSMARTLNAQGSHPRHAGEWRAEGIKKTIRSDHLLGRLRHRGVLVRDPDGAVLTPFDPILDVETMEQIRKRLAPGKQPDTRVRTLLSGFAFCASCGARCAAGGSGATSSYRCQSTASGKSCERPALMKRDWVDGIVEADLLDRFGSAEATIEQPAPSGPIGLVDLDAQIGQTVTALATATTEAEETELFALIRRLKADRQRLSGQISTDTVWTSAGMTLAESWPALSLEDRRRLLGLLGLRVSIAKGRPGIRKPDPSRVSIEWTASASS